MKHILILAGFAWMSLPIAARAAANAWDGAWTLDPARSSAGASQFAAPRYVFSVGADDRITWRIPALGEIVEGPMDGRPIPAHRTVPSPGLTLAVRADGAWLLHHKVARNGRPEGAGLRRLIESGKAWVEVSWRADKPEEAGELVYVRR